MFIKKIKLLYNQYCDAILMCNCTLVNNGLVNFIFLYRIYCVPQTISDKGEGCGVAVGGISFANYAKKSHPT